MHDSENPNNEKVKITISDNLIVTIKNTELKDRHIRGESRYLGGVNIHCHCDSEKLAFVRK